MPRPHPPSWVNSARAVLVSAALLLLLLSAGPATVSATPRAFPTGVTRYVLPIGSDASPACALGAPCQTIQRALAVAQAGDEVHVAAGTYTGAMFTAAIDQGVSATAIITTDIAAMRGGYSADFSMVDPQANPTILNASGAPGAYVLLVSGVSTVIEGFTLTGAAGACSPGCGVHYPGGAVRLRGGTPTLRHNRIENNSAYQRGGGVYVSDGAVATIDSNVILSNTVDGNGGGLYLQSANALVTNNQILSNTAVVEGGGLYVDLNVPAVIQNNAIGFNQATNPAASRGAGVRTIGDQAVVVLSHNDVFSNTLFWGGGAGLDVGGPAIVDGNAIHHNRLQLGGWGGALILAGVTQPVTVTNNVVYANHGSGVQSVNSTQVAFVNNTVAGNLHVAPDSGTEADAYLIWFDVNPSGPVALTVFNNILADNENCGLFYHAPNSVSISSAHNDSWNNHAGAANYCESAVPGAGDLSADPLFASPAAADYHLTPGSPALNIGTGAPAPAYDKDCVARPQGAGFDLGAYEWVPAHLSPTLNFDHQVFLPLIRVGSRLAC